MADVNAADTPLSAEQIERLKKSAAALAAYSARTQKLADCGYDCRAEEAWRASLAENINKLLQHFSGERRRT